MDEHLPKEFFETNPAALKNPAVRCCLDFLPEQGSSLALLPEGGGSFGSGGAWGSRAVAPRAGWELSWSLSLRNDALEGAG